jgi:hypothetical protein
VKRRGLILLSVALALMISSCRRSDPHRADPPKTGTMAPATPPGTAGNETDSALTQTMEIGEERSPNEGGSLTGGEHPTNAATASSAPGKKPHKR